MFNGYKEEYIIKHFEIDPGELEKLVKIWVFMHPEDNPEPKSPFSIFVNDRIKEISNITFLNLVRFKATKTIYWMDRYGYKTQTFLTDRPIEYLLEIIEKFVDNPESGLSKMLTLSEEEPVESKKKKKKGNKE